MYTYMCVYMYMYVYILPFLKSTIVDHLSETSFKRVLSFLLIYSRIFEKHDCTRSKRVLLCKNFYTYLHKHVLFNPISIFSHKTMQFYTSNSPCSYFDAANKCVTFVHSKSPELYSCVLEQLKSQVNMWDK